MEKKNALDIILNFICAFLFIAAGAATIILCHVNNYSYRGLLLGIILIVVSLIKIIKWLVNKQFKDKHCLTLPLCIASLALGILFLTEKINLATLCFVWGFYEITSSLIEIQMAIVEIKHNKLALIELAIELGTIVFGILLCIKLEHGLTGHLLFMSITLFLVAVMILLETAPQLKRKKENE